MNTKQKLWALIRAVKEDEIDASAFADQFTIIFDQETDYDTLTKLEETKF